ncbi:MAG: S1 RNA-binding domain-containing protein [Fimbriimonadales bacterium]
MWNDERERPENLSDESTPPTETTSVEHAESAPTIVDEPTDQAQAPEVSAETSAEPVAEPAAPVEPAAEASAQDNEPMTMDEAIEQSFRSFEQGEIVQATVVQVDRESALVDVGTKTEVKIPLSELSVERVSSAEEVVSVGDQIEVMVVRSRGEQGTPVLSKRLADFEKVWENIVDLYERKETIEAMVTERVKGGVVVDIGVRCFIPASQISRRIPPHQLDRLIGETIPLKIIDLDQEKRKAVGSNKLAEDEIRKAREQEERERRERVFAELKVGQRLRGIVKRISGYGAFVDIGGYEGLLHVSELAWGRVEDPREIIKEGDEIEVMVIRLEPEAGKVALSRRQVLPDPWQVTAQQYREGEEIEVPISRVVRTGAFARVAEGVEAFIPLSELTHKRGVKSAEDVVSAGETVKARIIELDPRRRRMVLSLRAMEEQRTVQEYQRSRPQPQRASTGFTIGERLQSQLQELQQSMAQGESETARQESDETAGTSAGDAEPEAKDE